MQYLPPAGILGATVAKLFGEEPEQQLKDDLGRLKMGAGESGVVGCRECAALQLLVESGTSAACCDCESGGKTAALRIRFGQAVFYGVTD